ncbi:MAG TPA: aldo/keto reductase [Blastocatellia bacterium]|nr:aldo/keto reductase [Blastocatellia bacterium]
MGMTGGATPEGTRRYAERSVASSSTAPGHYRQSNGLWLSSIGLGTYLGHWDDRTDQMYQEALKRSLEMGCNVIDSAVNYRFQRSERAIGATLKKVFESGKVSRDEVVVATKGGFFSFDGEPARDPSKWIKDNLIDTGVAKQEEMVDSHCMSPSYLEDQLGRSLENLGVDRIDIYYVHNPETQIEALSGVEFKRRLRSAFEFLEGAVANNKIGFYGTATWNGYREPEGSPGYLSLADVFATACEAGGADHHFRAIQLPYNLGMPEALTGANQILDGERLSALETATRLGLTVMCSASLLQGKLAQNLPPFVSATLNGLSTDGQRAIQFVRSTPGVTTALVGMSQRSHVEENMMLGRIPPAPIEEFLKLFGDHEADSA